ncbi:hypothetical protein ACFLQJ_01610, partial [Calditrichota bacterium]
MKFSVSVVALIAIFVMSFVFTGCDKDDNPAKAENIKTFSKFFGGSEEDVGYCVQETSHGGFVIAGKTNSYGAGYSDVWLIKTDASGNELWNRTFGGSESDAGYFVQETSDGGFVITGGTTNGAGDNVALLIKTDGSGNELWNKTFGGSDFDWGYCVQETSDGGFVITGGGLLIKTDGSGNELWIRIIEWGNYVQETSGGGFIIAGTEASDVWLIKTDASGNELWNRNFGGDKSDGGLSVQE